MELIGAKPVISGVWGYRLYKETGLIVKFEGDLYSSIYDRCYYLRDVGNKTIDLVPSFPGAIQESTDTAITWTLNGASNEEVVLNFIHFLQKENRKYESSMILKLNKTNAVIERLNKTLEDLRRNA